MLSKSLFEDKSLKGKPGLYPLTAESLLRVGLALCLYLKLHRQVERPKMALQELSFLTTALSAGFMAGGGDVHVGSSCGHISLRVEGEQDKTILTFQGLEDHELRMVESILFSRYNIPRAEGEEVGRIWIHA
ncbi:MAG: hypothetical protein N3C13_05805 [Aquificaceae bacterium]|nr:hypothetical protein [Aquificaceae bacterium]MCX8060696.1 hypothetical protein [Aquificaceae bacterium]MDW8096613.1 hypothetical protein [Aquificaceae bacterium]